MRILGISDDVTTCECCGKSNLKCTVVLTNGEGEVHYGRDCAARATAPRIGGRVYGQKSAAKIEQEARSIAAGVNPAKRLPRPYWSVGQMRAS
jgi:hypothetical protein